MSGWKGEVEVEVEVNTEDGYEVVVVAWEADGDYFPPGRYSPEEWPEISKTVVYCGEDEELPWETFVVRYKPSEDVYEEIDNESFKALKEMIEEGRRVRR